MGVAQQANHGRPEVGPRFSFVGDMVNIAKSAADTYGPTAVPDWRGFLREASAAGIMITAVAVVNKGTPKELCTRYIDFGYTVTRCTDAPDCDETVIAEIVRTCYAVDVVVIGGGDWKYRDVAVVLQQIGKRVIVAGVRGHISRDLLTVADAVVDFPVICVPEFPTEEGVPCAA